MAVIGKHNVTTDTPSNILLGAGTYHKGLKFSSGSWSGTPFGATSGGGKISIKGEYIVLDVDGALVKFKGQTVKRGGTAVAEINFTEINPATLKMGTLFKEGTTDAEGYVSFSGFYGEYIAETDQESIHFGIHRGGLQQTNYRRGNNV